MEYFEREEKILEIAKSKKVLHLGCVGFADLNTADRVKLAKESFHFKLSEISDTTGIDYSTEAIKYYQENGVFDNVVFGDAEKLEDVSITDTFDVIVAGDIIEHLSNPGLMLDGIKRFCNSNTTVIISTTHAFSLMNFVRYLFGRFHEGGEHYMTFNIQNVLNLLDKHGYNVISIDTCHQQRARKYALFFLGQKIFQMFPKFGGSLFIVATYNKN